MKPFINSGHAFVCFDSVTSLNIIIQHYRTSPVQNVKIFAYSIKEKFQRLFDWLSGKDMGDRAYVEQKDCC